MRYQDAAQDSVCPTCGSEHDSVHGFKDHHRDKHGNPPTRAQIWQAIADATSGGPV